MGQSNLGAQIQAYLFEINSNTFFTILQEYYFTVCKKHNQYILSIKKLYKMLLWRSMKSSVDCIYHFSTMLEL